MTGERVTTTTVPEGYTDAMARDIDTITQATPADVRGNVEIDASFKSFTFIKDLGEAPVYANQHTDKAFLARIGNHAVIPVAAMPGEKPITPVYETEQVEPVSKKITRGLGAVAMAPVKGVRKVNQVASAASIEVASHLPMFNSREEILETRREREEKYAKRDGDGAWTRMKKFVGRNAFKAAAWTMPTLMGVAAAGMLARGLDSGYHLAMHDAPYELMPMVSSRPIEVVMGGHWQGNPNDGYTQSLIDAGLIDPTSDIRPVHWSAQMAPLGGDTMTMQASDIEGAAQLRQVIDSANGEPVRVTLFSQGTEAGLRGLNEIAAEHGGRLPDNMEVVLVGGPSGKFGASGNNIISATNPFLGALGMEIDQPIPQGNVTIRTHVNDVFGNSADQSAPFTGLMAITPGHTVEGDVLLYTYQEGSTKYEVWGSASGANHPLSQLLEANGYPVTPDVDNLFNAAVPRTPHGQPTQYTDVNNVGDALGVVIENNTGHSGIAPKVIDAVLSEGRSSDLQTMTNLQKIPDQVARGDVGAVQQEVNDARVVASEYIAQPNKFVDAANDGLVGAGLPPLVPKLEEMAKIADAFVPGTGQFVPTAQHTAPFANIVSPQPGAGPAAAPNIAPMIQTGVNMFSNLLANSGRR